MYKEELIVDQHLASVGLNQRDVPIHTQYSQTHRSSTTAGYFNSIARL